jgi:hypothetical protein
LKWIRTAPALTAGLIILAAASVKQDPDPKPTPQPDRIAVTWDGDPATTMAITWRTDEMVDEAVAEIALATPDPQSLEAVLTVVASTTPLETESGMALYHSASVTGLKPNTLYAYRVGDGDDYWTEWNQIRTASTDPEPFEFIYVGDAQNDILSKWSRTIREAYSTAPDARFIIHAGDLVNNANDDGEWHEWFEAGGWIHRVVPSIPVPGNHEYSGGDLSVQWRPQFALPRHSNPELDETTYVVDFQGVRIVGLNSNTSIDEQADWLDSVLVENPNRWTVLTFHHPIFSAATGRDNSTLRKAWKPIFDRHGVDLVLQGHDHAYGRGHNIPEGVRAHDAEAGPVYVVSVSGPKMYDLKGRSEWRERSAEDTQLFQVINVGPDLLSYRAVTATGDLYDAFQIVVGADGVKRFVDGSVHLGPERRDN